MAGLPYQQQLVANVAEQPFTRSFEYSHDFDEQGLLFFIATSGLTRIWQNPHATGKVRAFASSIGSGSVEDFVGRVAVNCRTNNEQFAFMGVDLLDYRMFCPTSYTIRNRNSTSHVIQNWEFQASNDNFQTWVTLDRRELFTGNAQLDAMNEQAVKQLAKKGGSVSFSCDLSYYENFGWGGFRSFRIVQIGHNSSGSDNMCCSGIEMYGHLQAKKI